jgi:hypothetical protein
MEPTPEFRRLIAGMEIRIGRMEGAETISDIDLEQRTLQTIDNPFGTRLSPMS